MSLRHGGDVKTELGRKGQLNAFQSKDGMLLAGTRYHVMKQ